MYNYYQLLDAVRSLKESRVSRRRAKRALIAAGYMSFDIAEALNDIYS